MAGVAEGALAFVTMCPFSRNDRWDLSDKIG